MGDKFHKVDDGTILWNADHQYYYENNCYPNVRLICKGNYLSDKDNKKVYEIRGSIYLREDNFKAVGGNAYIWYK
ncbi:MAG: hypothetical protein SPC26_10415 [Lactobacillus amylovorus]|nr:hypothetical protein [Lactobacillus amylovorus]